MQLHKPSPTNSLKIIQKKFGGLQSFQVDFPLLKPRLAKQTLNSFQFLLQHNVLLIVSLTGGWDLTTMIVRSLDEGHSFLNLSRA